VTFSQAETGRRAKRPKRAHAGRRANGGSPARVSPLKTTFPT
jgi:hypothetical protein